MELHESQKKVARCPSRYRVLCSGRRWGKTQLAIWEMAAKAGMHSKHQIAYIAPTYPQARDIAWDALRDVTRPMYKSANESRMEISLSNESKIFLKGWESVESLRGMSFDFIVIDEIAMLRSWRGPWEEIIRPTLTDRKGHVLFCSTPKGFNHFYDLYRFARGDGTGGKGGRRDWSAFKFTSYDNPFIPKEEIDQARDEMTAESFGQEYLAEFHMASGMVCQWWDRKIHLISPPDKLQYFEAFDGGYHDPTAWLLIGFDGGRYYVVDGFREKGLTIEDVMDRRNIILAGRVPKGGIADSDDPRMISELNAMGCSFSPVSKIPGERKSWDETLAERLDHYGRGPFPQLYVAPHLTWLAEEIEMIMWKEQATKSEGTLPKWDMHRRYGHHFDGVKALAYFFVNEYNEGQVVSRPRTIKHTVPTYHEKAFDPKEMAKEALTKSRSWKEI